MHFKPSTSPPFCSFYSPTQPFPLLCNYFDLQAMAKRKRAEHDSADSHTTSKRKRSDSSSNTPAPKRKSSRRKSPPSQQETDLNIVTRKGDLFAAPPRTLLVHACNTLGHWGAGIATAFRERYPHAYEANKSHCAASDSASGTALLVPPDDDQEDTHFVGCLYTSAGVGRRKDPVRRIVENTEKAWGQLLRQVAEWNDVATEVEKVERIWICKINSGLFKVPWPRTVEVLKRVDLPDSIKSMEVVVVSRD